MFKNALKKNGYIFIVLLNTLFLVLLSLNNYGVWTDEVYSLNMIDNTYADIIRISNSLDNTLIYYLMLKFLRDILNIVNPKNIIVFARLFSTLPIIILMFLGYKKIQRNFGRFSALSFILLIFSGNIIYYSIEIRTYSWCILFSTLSYIEFILLCGEKGNWIEFISYSSIAFWFHKISIFPLAILYIFLLFRNLKNIKKIFIYYLLTVIFCVPILIYTFLYNINKLDFVYASGAIFPVFSISKIKESIVFPYDTGILYLSLFAIIVIGYSFCKNLIKRKINSELFIGIISLPITIIFLMILAYFSNHDYYPKYMLPALGIFLTAVSFLIDKSSYKKYLLSIFVVINLITYIKIYIAENNSKNGFVKLENYLDNNLKNDETIVINFDYGKNIIDYYNFSSLKDNSIIWENEYIKGVNRVYLIQTNRLNSFFNKEKYEVINEFNISNDMFSLCIDK